MDVVDVRIIVIILNITCTLFAQFPQPPPVLQKGSPPPVLHSASGSNDVAIDEVQS